MQSRVLTWVERAGNRLPDPVAIFLYLILALAVFSAAASALNYGVGLDPHVLALLNEAEPSRRGIADGRLTVHSLTSAANLQRLLSDMPTTFTHFHPLGYVLVVMLGAGVAERTKLFSAAMRAAVRSAPKSLLTPVVVFIAMSGNHAADAAYVVLIPLAGILYAAVGRHPIAGIAASFAGVSGGFSANFAPGQLDALLFGITESAAGLLHPDWPVNFAGNWYFIVALMLLYLPVIWIVTDKVIEPRLGPWAGGAVPDPASVEDAPGAPLTQTQKKGLRRAGLALVAVVTVWVWLTIGPGTPLMNDGADSVSRLAPLFRSLVAGFLVLFLAAGVAYGTAVGTIKTHRDVIRLMSEAMADLAYYLVLAFVSAHFVAMFDWSNLGLIFAVQGAAVIDSSDLPVPILLASVVFMAGAVNLFVGSASAKWALLAPVLVPMLMLLGVSPEAATAAYRVGDSATNVATPLLVYFPLVLVFARRWQSDFGLGSLTAMMLPYSLWLLLSGLLMTVAWVYLGLPLGPGAGVGYSLPGPGA